ncbi:tyrosyl-DNA phosphodiesterase-domain-containing protein [Cantharellus anzutake]|uniref:tyrosyl-DNA phosphodiesterase-domain-containing protein n=1 Tax=Cantharellus anzutake TaxID=1750568 RepID=UPI0019065970|nr:tyrosyl-DNA phosphodiesterase-domain-containing protein [Cantharellus anzutake]KAF8330786.1 tyrosyl-DNA phosphodiesterase-domain-containing protein [Cantharellus anzutake]
MNEIIDVDDLSDADSDIFEQQQLEEAIALSLSESREVIDVGDAESSTRQSSNTTTSNPTSFPSDFLKERARLEEARLQRRKRRFESVAVDAPQKASGSSDHSQQSVGQLAKRRKIELPLGDVPTPLQTSISKHENIEPFWDGTLRQTPSRFSNYKPKFSLKDIIGESSAVEWSIMTAMDIDFDWVATCFPISVPNILVSSPARSNGYTEATVKRLDTTSWFHCTPWMPPGHGVMHTKLCLYFRKDGCLRVAVNTANLLDYDWWGIENMSWVQDFPLLASSTQSPEAEASHGKAFRTTLIAHLKRMNVEAGMKAAVSSGVIRLPKCSIEAVLNRYDFSKVKIRLVASLPGTFTGQEMQTVGHTGLMRALRTIGARTPPGKDLSLEYQGSSIGRYTADWIQGFRISATGGNGYNSWLSMSAKAIKEQPYPSKSLMKILYPTLETVDAAGRHRGGSMFLSPSTWEAKNFPRQLFHDPKATSGSILMHTKMMLGLFVSKKNGVGPDTQAVSGIDGDVGGWCYVGSHNFSPSAWGTLSREKRKKRATGRSSKARRDMSDDESQDEDTPSINIRNFELGILFPFFQNELPSKADEVACWKRPVPPYNRSKPWVCLRLLDSMIQALTVSYPDASDSLASFA